MSVHIFFDLNYIQAVREALRLGIGAQSIVHFTAQTQVPETFYLKIFRCASISRLDPCQ